jgi:DNA processing protein
VPGPVTSAASAGCHKLLRETPAICVTDADEMAELVGMDAVSADQKSTSSRAISPAIDPTGTRVRLLDALSDRSGRSVTRISELSGLAADRVRAELGLLELEGIVRELPGGWQKFTVKQLEERR